MSNRPLCSQRLAMSAQPTWVVPYLSRGPGTYRLACPQCNRTRRDDALALTFKDDGGWVAFCHRCSFTASSRGLRAAVTAPARPAAAPPPVQQRWSAKADFIWGRSLRLDGEDPVSRYLRARGCVVPTGGDLRWLTPSNHYPHPTMLARITDAVANEPMSLHFTVVTDDGSGEKASVDVPKRLLGGHQKVGGVVRLWADEDVTQDLAVAEGIESALSAAHVFTPVWACIDASNLGAFPVLSGIDALTIFADDDAAGRDAAYATSTRWRSAGRECGVKLSASGGDPNDAVRRVRYG